MRKKKSNFEITEEVHSIQKLRQAISELRRQSDVDGTNKGREKELLERLLIQIGKRFRSRFSVAPCVRSFANSDVMQEAAMVAIEHPSRIPNARSSVILAWFQGVYRRIGFRRLNRIHYPEAKLYDHSVSISDVANDATCDDVIDDYAADIVDHFFEMLDTIDRRILQFWLEGLSFTEIGKEVGLDRGNVSRRLKKTIESLRFNLGLDE